MATDHGLMERTRCLSFAGTMRAARLRSGATLVLAAALAACGSSKATNSQNGTGGTEVGAGGSSRGTAGESSGSTAGRSGGGTAGNTTANDASTTVGSGGSGGQGIVTPSDSGAGGPQNGGGMQDAGDATNPQSDTGGPDIPEDCVVMIRSDAGRSDTDADLDGESYDPDASPFGSRGTGGASAEASAEASAPVVLDRKGWKILEVSSYFNNGEVDKPEYAIDDDPTTRWATGVAQADDPDPKKRQRILIDMGERQSICRITIDSRGPDSKTDQAKEFDLFISDSDQPTDVTLHAVGSPITEIQFDKVKRGRYLGVVNRGSDATLWWSIWDLRAYR